jgi:WXG100 family type VII secretion target
VPIRIEPADLRDHAAAIRNQVAQTTGDVNNMRSRLEALSGTFEGAAAVAFDARWTEWQTHSSGLLEALDSLASFLSGTADTMEELDNELARRANGA